MLDFHHGESRYFITATLIKALYRSTMWSGMKLHGVHTTSKLLPYADDRCYLSDLLEVIVALLERPCSVKSLAHAAVFVQENFPVLLDPVQHLWDGEVGIGWGVLLKR